MTASLFLGFDCLKIHIIKNNNFQILNNIFMLKSFFVFVKFRPANLKVGFIKNFVTIGFDRIVAK
jgi:hypothetical protein